MPTNVSKGDHGTADSGSKEAGGQKATYGSAVSPEVAAEQADVIVGEGDPTAEDAGAVAGPPPAD
ncbi:MAG: hypothetical protein KY458_11840 [Actinobacteria bacterium]|nr:hypothetical protein [Actinomycetota bacterium]